MARYKENHCPSVDQLPAAKRIRLSYAPLILTYQPSSTIHQPQLLFVAQTVATITVNDDYKDLQPTTYRYSRGYFDLVEQELRGFAVVTHTKPNGTKSVTAFHKGLWRKGRQYQVDTRDSSAAHVKDDRDSRGQVLQSNISPAT